MVSKDTVVTQETPTSACATVSLNAVDVGFSSMRASYSYASVEEPGKQVTNADADAKSSSV